jgi:hypothetical protein
VLPPPGAGAPLNALLVEWEPVFPLDGEELPNLENLLDKLSYYDILSYYVVAVR